MYIFMFSFHSQKSIKTNSYPFCCLFKSVKVKVWLGNVNWWSHMYIYKYIKEANSIYTYLIFIDLWWLHFFVSEIKTGFKFFFFSFMSRKPGFYKIIQIKNGLCKVDQQFLNLYLIFWFELGNLKNWCKIFIKDVFLVVMTTTIVYIYFWLM